MKRGEGDDSEGSVKRLTSSLPVVQNQVFIQPQHFTSLPLLPSAGTGSLVGAPTAVAISVQTQQGPLGDNHQCLLGGAITYGQPNIHSAPCNIVLASSQPYVATAVPVSHVAGTCGGSANNLSSVTAVPVTHIPSTCDSTDNLNSSCVSSAPLGSSVVSNYALLTESSSHHGYGNATELRQAASSYPSTCNVKRNAPVGNNVDSGDGDPAECLSKVIPEEPENQHRLDFSKPTPPNSPKKRLRSKLPSAISKRLQESKNAAAAPYAIQRSQESLKERQERLSQKFNLLIRSKILELVRARGTKKTVCPSEVARALSPKAWRDLMQTVRKIGAELVEEGLILVTQRGIVVDLATVRGPVREKEEEMSPAEAGVNAEATPAKKDVKGFPAEARNR